MDAPLSASDHGSLAFERYSNPCGWRAYNDSVSVTYGGRSKPIPRASIDTGAAHTIVVLDVVDNIGIVFKTGDQINR